MYSDFWFNSESVLTDARLPTALSVIPHPPLGGLVGYMLTHPHQEQPDPTRQGVAVAGADAPPIKARHGTQTTTAEYGSVRGCILCNKVKKKKKKMETKKRLQTIW